MKSPAFQKTGKNKYFTALWYEKKTLNKSNHLSPVCQIQTSGRTVAVISLELANIVKIPIDRVLHILHENLGLRKLYQNCVPRLLTVDQKERVDDPEQCSKLFGQNKNNFFMSLMSN